METTERSLLEETIDDAEKIRKLIEATMVEDGMVEVEINRRTRLFFTHFCDHPPELEEITDEKGQVSLREPFYRPLSYLFQHDHLLLEPLHPAVGNAQIRTSQEVLIRFFQGIRTLEGQVTFIDAFSMRGEPVIRVTFPQSLSLMRKRRFFRANLEGSGQRYEVEVRKPGHKPITGRLLDISSNGLAFCNPAGPEEWPTGETVEFVIPPFEEGGEGMRIKGIIRNYAPLTGKDGGSAEGQRCGVQLDITSKQVAQRVDALVATVQREMLQKVMARRARINSANERPRAPEKNPREEEIKRFFAHKAMFNILK